MPRQEEEVTESMEALPSAEEERAAKQGAEVAESAEALPSEEKE